ncbi:MAG: hypothetical protein R3B93_18045 [Bacteroidia bacterium]
MDNEFEINRAKPFASEKEQAFLVLYERYSEKVYNTVIELYKVSKTKKSHRMFFYKNIQNASKFKESFLNTWIYRIVVNTSLNFLKEKKQICFVQKQHSALLENIDWNIQEFYWRIKKMRRYFIKQWIVFLIAKKRRLF